MSYFMIVTGDKPSVENINGISAIPVNNAQEYIKKVSDEIISDISKSEQWLIIDETTDTTDDLIAETPEQLCMEHNFDETRFGRVLNIILENKNNIIIWYANNSSDCYKNLRVFNDANKFTTYCEKTLRDSEDIAAEFIPIK